MSYNLLVGYRSSSRNAGEELTAGLFAHAADRRTDPAVDVHFGMTFTFFRTDAAGRESGLHLDPHQLRIGFRLSRQDPGRCLADIGTVEVDANAARKHLHILLAKAGIGTGSTRIGAIYTGGDAGGEVIKLGEWFSWMTAQHFLCLHVGLLSAEQEIPSAG